MDQMNGNYHISSSRYSHPSNSHCSTAVTLGPAQSLFNIKSNGYELILTLTVVLVHKVLMLPV